MSRFMQLKLYNRTEDILVNIDKIEAIMPPLQEEDNKGIYWVFLSGQTEKIECWDYRGFWGIRDDLVEITEPQYPVPTPAQPVDLGHLNAEPYGCPDCHHDKWEHQLTYDGRLRCRVCMDDEDMVDCFIITPQHLAWLERRGDARDLTHRH